MLGAADVGEAACSEGATVRTVEVFAESEDTAPFDELGEEPAEHEVLMSRNTIDAPRSEPLIAMF